MKPRTAITKILYQVINNKRSMSQVLPEYLSSGINSKDVGFIKDVCFGVLRWYFLLKHIENSLLHTPLKQKDTDISCIILSGLYQIYYSNAPDYAAVSETVSVCKDLKKAWATALVNKVLRKFIREKEALLENLEDKPAAYYAHPNWFIQRLKKAWPEQWEKILTANNHKPPLFLRVNQQKISRDDYLLVLITSIKLLIVAFVVELVLLCLRFFATALCLDDDE